jgi:hypothetical protein
MDALNALNPQQTRLARTPGVSGGLAGLQRAVQKGTPLTAAQAKEAATQLVSEVAFKPLLAELRQQPFGDERFHGGRTEEIFGERLDERLADAAARATVPKMGRQFQQYFAPHLGGLQVDWNVAQQARPPVTTPTATKDSVHG